MGTIAERRAEKGKAAYFLVDMGSLPADVRKEIEEDAFVGGKEFGVQIVEEHINGPVRVPVYGVYEANKELWEAAKTEFDIETEEVDDEALRAGELRDGAAGQAGDAADRIRAAEDAELKAITGEDDGDDKPKSTKNKAPR